MMHDSGVRLMRKCKLCSRKITGNRCDYCKLYYVELLSNEIDSIEFSRIDEHKRNLLNEITDFSVSSYICNNVFLTRIFSSVETLIVDKIDSSEKIYWSNQYINAEYEKKKQSIEMQINYKCSGKTKTIKVTMKTPTKGNQWKIGVKINSNMTVSFLIGNENNFSSSSEFDLEFE